MTESSIFVAGAIVTIVVFAGGFLFAMLSFGRWADRDSAMRPPKRT